VHSSTEAYNNEQVLKVFGRISFEICLKMNYFLVVNPPKLPSAGAPAPDPLASGDRGLCPRPPFRI